MSFASHTEKQKSQKALQNRLSKIESQIQQLEKDIQHDDKELASNYDKHIENASFFAAYERKKKDFRNPNPITICLPTDKISLSGKTIIKMMS